MGGDAGADGTERGARATGCGTAYRVAQGGGRRRCTAAVLFLSMVLVGAAADPGPNAHLVDSYNVLHDMLVARAAVAGWNLFPVGFGPATLETGVRQPQLQRLRQTVLNLAAVHYYVEPSSYLLDTAYDLDLAFSPAYAFDAAGVLRPGGVMGGLGHNGVFTKVPAVYTADNTAIYSNAFVDVPPLWVHFEELYAAIGRLRYRRGVWGPPPYHNKGGCKIYARGEPNYRYAYGYAATGAQALENARANFEATTPWNLETEPAGLTVMLTKRRFDYRATVIRLYTHARVDNLSIDVPHSTRFYTFASMPWGSEGHVYFNSFGDPVRLSKWTLWDHTPPSTDATVWSAPLGSVATPASVSIPEAPLNLDASAGWGLYDIVVMHEHYFQDPPLQRPALADYDTLLDPCGPGPCAAGPQLGFAGPGSLALQAHMPLGSSSFAAADIGVRAAFQEGGAGNKGGSGGGGGGTGGGGAPLAFSLDARIVDGGANASEGWDFSTVRRPSGADITFTLQGGRAGQSVDPGPTTLAERVGDNLAISFPDSPGRRDTFRSDGRLAEVVHNGMSVRLLGVSIAPNGLPEAATLHWPGLTVHKHLDGRVAAVDAPAWTATPSYAADGSLSGVRYDSRSGEPLNSFTRTVEGDEQVYRTFDADGTALVETRALTNTAWVLLSRGVLPGAHGTPGGVAQQQLRTEAIDSATGLIVVHDRLIQAPGTAAEEAVETRIVAKEMVWGREVLTNTIDWGGSDPRTTATLYDETMGEPGLHSFTRPIRVTGPDGDERALDYVWDWRVSELRQPFLQAGVDDTNACRVTRLYYRDTLPADLGFPEHDERHVHDGRPRLSVEYIGTQELRRVYSSFQGSRTVTVEGARPGVRFDDPANRVSSTQLHTDGEHKGRVRRIDHPDGAVSLFAYTYDAALDRLTRTVDRGVPAGEAIVDGIRTVTVSDGARRVLSSRTLDIASGALLDEMTYTRDARGRETLVTNTVTGAAVRHEYQDCCHAAVMRDAEGLVTTNQFDRLGRLTNSVCAGVATRRTYDVNGHVAREVVAAGAFALERRVERHGSGRPRRVVAPGGLEATFTYGTNAVGAAVITSRRADGAVAVETAWLDGSMASLTGSAVHAEAAWSGGVVAGSPHETLHHGPDTGATAWTRALHDPFGRRAEVVFADGHRVRTAYDAADRPVRVDDGFTVTLLDHDTLGRVVRSGLDVDGDGRLEPAGPDPLREVRSDFVTHEGRPARRTRSLAWPESGVDRAVVVFERIETLDGAVAWTVQAGVTQRVEVVRHPAAAARLEVVRDPDGTTRRFAWTNGLLRTSAWLDAGGTALAVERREYDPLRRPAAVHTLAPDGSELVTRVLYDAAGRATATVAQAGGELRRATFAYDAQGQLACVRGADGSIVSNRHDLAGRVVERVGVGVWPARWSYDAQGRVETFSTLRDGLDGPADTSRWTYDPLRGRPIARTFPDGSVERVTHDGAGRPVETIDPEGRRVRHAYDAAGNLTNTVHVSAAGVATTVATLRRDRLGRVVETRDAAGVRTNRWDDSDALQEVQFPGGLRHVFAYDAIGRMTNQALRAAGGPLTAIGYGYDLAGRPARVRAGDREAAYAYAADGRTPRGYTLAVAGVETLRVEDEPDAWGRVARRAVHRPGDATWSYGVGYDASGRPDRLELPDGAIWRYAYDAHGQLVLGEKRFADDDSPVPGAVFRYAYDTAGNRVRAAQPVEADPGEAETVFNALSQPVSATVPPRELVTGIARPEATVRVGDGAAPATDARRHGKYFWHVRPVTNTVQTVFTTNRVFAVRRVADGAMTNDYLAAGTRPGAVLRTPRTFHYDLTGNLTNDGRFAYTWTADSRLAALESVPGVPPDRRLRLTLVHDAAGRCVERHAWRWDSTAGGYALSNTVRVVYDAGLPLAEVETLATAPDAPRVTAHVRGLDVSGSFDGAGGIGGLLWTTASGGGAPDRWVVSDPFGSARASGDDAQGLHGVLDYEPFGRPIEQEGESLPVGFSGKPRLPSGHLDFGYRLYDPETARWLSRDPLRESGGHNLHAYANNAPPATVDPWGLRAYGRDYTGVLDWTDWKVEEYTQAEVDVVYAVLSVRDRHLYNPGLANPIAYQQANEALLEKILGVEVLRIQNTSMNQFGNDLMCSSNGVVRALGRPLAGLGTFGDWMYAGVNKVPVARYVDPSTRATVSAYEAAMAQVETRGGTVYAWMHSEGSIHGSIAVKRLIDEDNKELFRGVGLGPGTASFGKHAHTRLHRNQSEGHYLIWRNDPVVQLAAGGLVRKRSTFITHTNVQQKVTECQPSTNKDYVHGFPTYAETSVLPDAISYFERNAPAILRRRP